MATKYAKQLNQERSCSDFIPFSSHVDKQTLITKEGDLLRIWKVGGISFETAEYDEISRKTEQLNTLYKGFASNHVSLWSHMLRRKTSDRLIAHYDNKFCEEFDKKYYDSFTEKNNNGYKMMGTELYLTVIYRPTPNRINKFFGKNDHKTISDINLQRERDLKALDEICSQIEASLGGDSSNYNKYDLTSLCIYTENNTLYSEPLTLINYLLTGEWQKIRLPKAPLYEYLGNVWLFAGTETIEVRTPDRTRFIQGIDFKDYGEHTETGMLNGLMYEDYEFIITQSFSFMGKRDGIDFLKRQKKQLISGEDASETQIIEMDVAIDELQAGLFAMGEYHFSMLIFGDSVEEVIRNRNSATTIIRNEGFLASLINTATDAAYYAQLPANWSYRPRIAKLTSHNFAELCCFHNFSAGKRDNNPWGQAVTLFQTPSGQPLYFNFHFSKIGENSYDDKPLGNTRIIGQSGAGKTVLMSTLLCQLQKYAHNAHSGFSTVFFDKDHGAEILIRAIGGKYLAIENGKPTGFNPFQIEATEANILFLEELVKYLVRAPIAPLTINEELKISHAVRTTMRMDKSVRRLSFVQQNITEGNSREEKENSIVKRLSKWCEGGSLSWVFDNPYDELDFTQHRNFGIDGTQFLDNPDVCTPISMYLLFRMESIIDGRRFVYFMDEAWKWIDDIAFADFAGDKQLTIRKQNGLGVFSTQMPSSLLKSKIASALVQQCATEIYLPNPKADYEEYTKGFKVTDGEFEIIKSMPEDCRMFLIKQGHKSMIGRLNLAGFDEELNVLSGTEDNIALLYEIFSEVGEDPSIWLPIFQERLKQRKSQKPIQH